jgi:hypothetical protein
MGGVWISENLDDSGNDVSLRGTGLMVGGRYHLKAPKISDFIIPLLGHRLVLNARIFPNLDLQPTLVGKVKQANETEARADVLHLVLRIRLS